MSQPKSFYAILILSIVGLAVVVIISDFRTRSGGSDPITNMTSFVGGPFEASGVTEIPGRNEVLFVDNGRPGKVFMMRFDESGKQSGEIKGIDLGVGIEDIEGITHDGTYFYVVSSQSRPKAIESDGLVRFKFDAETQTVSAVESISKLKAFIVKNVTELGDEGEKKGKRGGLNIEGLAWDPQHSRLLLGLRSPVVDDLALLVPLKLKNPNGPFALDNLQAERCIRLSLGGLGIRGVEYDKRAKGYKILSGAAEDQTGTDFALWEWNGNEQKPGLRELNKFDKSLKAEGVARVKIGKSDRLLVVFDSGGYALVDSPH
jgi:hypothetical protein